MSSKVIYHLPQVIGRLAEMFPFFINYHIIDIKNWYQEYISQKFLKLDLTAKSVKRTPESGTELVWKGYCHLKVILDNL